MRLLAVDDEFFRRGAKAFFDGIDWESIPESDRQNKLFIQGYEDAATINTTRRK